MRTSNLLTSLLAAAATRSFAKADTDGVVETIDAVRSSPNCEAECNSSSSEQPSPLRIFILAGQSNMVGQADVGHLKQLINDTETHDEFAHLWNNETESWRERGDVYCKFDQHVHLPGYNKLEGKLKPGFGGVYSHGKHFGPELGFGIAMGDAVACQCDKDDDGPQILLIKTADGGKNLAIDFRPPSSGIGDYKKDDWGNMYNATGPGPFNEATYGAMYRQMMTDVKGALSHLSVPGYASEQGYVLEGFVWFQGWNDMLDGKKVDEYADNLANLIRDVRKDLSAPSLPFIVGELGQKGLHPHSDPIKRMRRAQKSVTKMDEFYGNALFVRTAQYVTDEEPSFNGNYHYNGRADTMYRIGRIFAEGMLYLISVKEQSGHRMLRSSTEPSQSRFWKF